jgi:hypothetical protein
MAKRANRTNKDIANKIWLQQEAIATLTGDLLAAAVAIDESPPPPDRPFTVWQTPPIKGFNINDYNVEDDQQSDDEDAINEALGKIKGGKIHSRLNIY